MNLTKLDKRIDEAVDSLLMLSELWNEPWSIHSPKNCFEFWQGIRRELESARNASVVACQAKQFHLTKGNQTELETSEQRETSSGYDAILDGSDTYLDADEVIADTVIRYHDRF